MEKNQEKEFNLSLSKLARSSIILFGITIFSKLIFYVYRISVVRYYGPEVYGLLSLSLMLVGWFSIFSTLGLHYGLVRYISLFRGKNENKKINYITKRVFWTLFFTGIIGGAILFFGSNFISLKIFNEVDLIPFLKIFAFVLPITVLSGIFLNIMRAYEKISALSFIEKILDSITKVGVLLLFILMGIGFLSVPLSYLISAFVVLIIAIIFCKSNLNTLFKNQDINQKGLLRKVFSYSIPLMWFGVAASFFGWTDTFVIGIFENSRQVGFYNAAWPIASLMAITSEIFIKLFFPLTTKEFSKGNDEVVKQLSQQVGKWIFTISLPILVVFLLFPGVFLNILFGAEYTVATNTLRFLAIGTFFSVSLSLTKELIFMKGKSKILLIDILILGLINLALNILLVPKYGIEGAAFATMVSMILLNLTYTYQTYKYLKIVPVRRKMAGIVLITIFASAVLLLLKSFVETTIVSMVLLGIFFFLLYFILIFLLSLDKNDLNIIKLIKKHLFFRR